MNNEPSEYADLLRRAWNEARAQGHKERTVQKVIRRLPDGNTEVLDIVEMYETGAGVIVVVR